MSKSKLRANKKSCILSVPGMRTHSCVVVWGWAIERGVLERKVTFLSTYNVSGIMQDLSFTYSLESIQVLTKNLPGGFYYSILLRRQPRLWGTSLGAFTVNTQARMGCTQKGNKAMEFYLIRRMKNIFYLDT